MPSSFSLNANAEPTGERLAYKAKIDLTFHCSYNNQDIKIAQEKIVYVMIDSNYEANVIPIIYVTIACSDTLYKLINDYKKDSTFSLTIKKYPMNRFTAIPKITISDVFNYLPSTTSDSYMEELNLGMDDAAYSRITLGLVSKSLINNLRKSFGDIYNNIDAYTMAMIALEGTNPIVDNFKINKEYEQIEVSPQNTRYQFIKFIFEKDPFFWTNFVFFMDFDRTYLISKEGNGIDAGDGKPLSVILDIRSIMDSYAVYEGMKIENGAYHVYFCPTDVEYNTNEALQQVINNVITVDEDTGVKSLNIDFSEYTFSDILQKDIYVREENAFVIKNELELGASTIELSKAHIDGSIFSPNKEYHIVNYGANSSYDGKYILVNKKEFYKYSADEFIMGTTLAMKMVGQLHEPEISLATNTETYTRKVNKSVKKTTKRITTAFDAKQRQMMNGQTMAFFFERHKVAREMTK